MRTMRDSTRFADIPLDGCDLVMGYVNDPRVSSRWSDDEWAKAAATGKTLVRLCIYNDRLEADAIDCEPGNNDASGCVPFIAGKWARGQTPTVYCFTDRGPTGYRISDVRAACDAAGVRHPLFLLTDFDGEPTLPDDPEVVGKQYANDAFTGGHYDQSVVADHWEGVDKDMTEDQVKAIVAAALADYAQRLQQELDQNYARKGDAPAPHSHTGTVSVT